MRERQNTRYWSNTKKILGSTYLLLKHDISAQNEGKHVLATFIFQNFLREHAPRPRYWGDACGVISNGCAIADLTLCQQINLRALQWRWKKHHKTVHQNLKNVKIMSWFVFELRICSCLACVYRVMDARGKFGEHERCVRVARGDSRVQL